MSMEVDEFSAYRAMCTSRLQRLERYKKARSFCNLDEMGPEEASTSEKRLSEMARPPSPICSEDSEGEKSADKENNSSYEVIRDKMMELMENDVAILQQLLNLGDQVAAMRKKGGLRRTQSTNSVERAEEDDEFDDQFDEPPFSASMSEVTRLVVDDDQPQYFSRQNSVLRIPIQPRRSNRFGSKRVPRRPSEILLRPAARQTLRVTTDESLSSSESSSDGPASPLSHTPSTVSSKSSLSSASEAAPKKSRSSNSSIDSGIRESSDSPSPTFERQI